MAQMMALKREVGSVYQWVPVEDVRLGYDGEAQVRLYRTWYPLTNSRVLGVFIVDVKGGMRRVHPQPA